MVQLKIERALRCDSLKYVFINEEVPGWSACFAFHLTEDTLLSCPLTMILRAFLFFICVFVLFM